MTLRKKAFVNIVRQGENCDDQFEEYISLVWPLLICCLQLLSFKTSLIFLKDLKMTLTIVVVFLFIYD